MVDFIPQNPGFDFPNYSFYEVRQVRISLRFTFLPIVHISLNLSDPVVMLRLDDFMYYGNFVARIDDMSESKPCKLVYLPFLTLLSIKGILKCE